MLLKMERNLTLGGTSGLAQSVRSIDISGAPFSDRVDEEYSGKSIKQWHTITQCLCNEGHVDERGAIN